jgi:hypothetical protein
MKDKKKPLQLLQRTSEPDDQLLGDSKQGVPVVFVDLETFTLMGAIDVIVAGPVVVLPRVHELTYVPAPRELQ